MTKSRLRPLLLGTASVMALLTGCSTVETVTNTGTFPGNYNTVAYKPKDPSAIRVKVSLEDRMVYVMEGSRPLLVTPITIGTSGKGTPLGSYRVTNKELNKRSGSYGFWVNGNEVVAGESGRDLLHSGAHSACDWRGNYAGGDSTELRRDLPAVGLWPAARNPRREGRAHLGFDGAPGSGGGEVRGGACEAVDRRRRAVEHEREGARGKRLPRCGDDV